MNSMSEHIAAEPWRATSSRHLCYAKWERATKHYVQTLVCCLLVCFLLSVLTHATISDTGKSSWNMKAGHNSLGHLEYCVWYEVKNSWKQPTPCEHVAIDYILYVHNTTAFSCWSHHIFSMHHRSFGWCAQCTRVHSVVCNAKPLEHITFQWNILILNAHCTTHMQPFY